MWRKSVNARATPAVGKLESIHVPLVANLRGLSAHGASAIAIALHTAGFRMLVVPVNLPGAMRIIEALAALALPATMIGGSGVIAATDAEMIYALGGRLCAFPHTDPSLIAYARGIGLLPMPGVATLSEAFAAHSAGAHVLNLLPAESVGLAGLRAMRHELPFDAQLWPIGDLGAGQVGAWMSAGASGFGVDKEVFCPGMSPTDVMRSAQRFVHAWRCADALKRHVERRNLANI